MIEFASRALRLLSPVLLAAALCLPQAAASADPCAHEVQAHPALWTVHGPKGTAYMLGSVHILPPCINWKTREIMAAMKRADVFVFEIPLDHRQQDTVEAQAIQRAFMDHNGMLPPGQSLRALLPANMTAKYDIALDKLQLAPNYVDRLKPWLVSTIFETAQFVRSEARAENGIDVRVYAMADDMHKKTRGFETLEDQLAVVTHQEERVGLSALAQEISETMDDVQGKMMDELVSDWVRGDVAAMGRINNAAFDKDPALKKAMLDDRNARWVGELKKMLEQDQVYFITVGTAHLIGPGGVPALMRAAGYAVDGPGLADDGPARPGLRQAAVGD
jgi:uncharacterized protein YbaP (TraB family)